MMNFRKILYLSLALLSVLFLTLGYAAEKPGNGKNDKQSLRKTSGVPTFQILNINNLYTWQRYDGESNHDPAGGDGVYYPVGTGNVVYEDGMVFGGKQFLDAARTVPSDGQKIRVGGGTYLSNVGTKAGYVTGVGASAQAASPDAPDVRIYRVRRDYAQMTQGELRYDAQTSYLHLSAGEVSQGEMDAIAAQYAKDWVEWPVDKGAPYIERNGKPGYQAPPAFSATFTVDSLISGGYDEPGCGDPNSPADQVMWTAYNDLDASQSLRFEGSNPTGLEVGVTKWAYKRTDALGNCYFTRFRITNKGGVDLGAGTKGVFYLDSMYVCQWSDIDLGYAFDDLVGCDSARGMAYIYNSAAVDNVFSKFGLPPPASGYTFLGGSTVPGTATDSAVVNFKRVFGKKNLPMTGFSYFSAGSPYSDPGFTTYPDGTGRWWNMLRGYAPLGTISDAPVYYAYPDWWYPTRFPLSGDPRLGIHDGNFVDGAGTLSSFVPGDRRLLLCTGPFQMNPGDVQEIYVGYVCGLGADRISSISVLFANNDALQTTFNLLFKVAKAPAAPLVQVTEMDGAVMLDWSNPVTANATEVPVKDPGHYAFEGYNIYQFTSPNASLNQGKRIATYDVVDDIKVILNEQFDLTAGAILKVPIQYGSDAGVKRYFLFKRDFIRDIDKIYNGQAYYLGVSAYSYTSVPGYIAALESNPNILTVVPKVPFGVSFTAKIGDTLAVTKTGVSDGNVVPIVLNPGATTGHTYKITFAADATWAVADQTLGKTIVSKIVDQTGDDAYPIVDGVMPRVTGAPNDFKYFECTANGTGKLTPPDMGTFAFNSSGFPVWNTFDRPQVANIAGGGMWGITSGNNDGASFEYPWFISRTTRAGANWGRIIPYDFEIRFTAAGGKALNNYTDGLVIDVPFELWNIGSGTPDDPKDDYRMIPYTYDINGNDVFDLDGVDHPISGGDNDPETDWIYWEDPSDKTPGQAGYNAAVAANFASGVGSEVFARMVLVNWNGGSVSAATWPNNVNQKLPAVGSVYRIVTTKPNNPLVSFTYTTPAPVTGADQSKVSAKNVGVFPNPYYAFNTAETNRFYPFVTFNNLPPHAIIRIFNLAGQLVRTIEKNNASQFQQWDLMNQRTYPVASGVYIAYVDMPEIGITKTLKFTIFQGQEILDFYQ